MASGDSYTPGGMNSSGRTPDEQKRFEQRKKIAEMEKKNPIADAIKGFVSKATKPVYLGKNQGTKNPVLPGSPNMAKITAVQKAKKATKQSIPTSPTH